MAVADALLAEYDREMALTRRLLERMPADQLDWRPHPQSAPMAGLGRHLAHVVSWGSLALTQHESTVSDRTPLPPTTTLRELLSVFDSAVATTRTLLAGKTDADLTETWTLTHQGRILFASSRAAVVQSLILNHVIHHRGQLSVYLRLNNVPLPSMYGPSADEA